MADYNLRIEADVDAPCPMTEWDGQWTLYSFKRNSVHYRDPNEFVKVVKADNDIVPSNIGLRRKLEVGLAHWVSYYEHSYGKYSLIGEGTQCRWDSRRLAGILVWENKPSDMGAKTYDERATDARNFLESYNNWMNGWINGVVFTNRDGEDAESCWGFFTQAEFESYIAEVLSPGDRVQVVEDMGFTIHLPEGIEVVTEWPEVLEPTAVTSGVFPIL
jgi:hypothetical protein